VARAWTETNEEVDGIGQSVEGLAESFEMISENASTALEVAGSGVLAARTAQTAIEDLDQSTKQIEAILTFIDQIADQSKLLSLNASIEAARAGDTGRGFNVVAQEVKKLATQTEYATGQIAVTISEILERGDRSVASIHAIGSVIDEINESQSLIASIVADQQTQAQSVSRVTEETRRRAHVIAASIEQLSLVAEATEVDAAGTDREARRLLDLATQISDLTERFVC
jgi:methyl-accepting chemotaxis protein